MSLRAPQVRGNLVLIPGDCHVGLCPPRNDMGFMRARQSLRLFLCSGKEKASSLYTREPQAANLPELSFDKWLMEEGVTEDYGRSIPNADAYQTTNLKQQTTNTNSKLQMRSTGAFGYAPRFSSPGRVCRHSMLKLLRTAK